MFLVALFIAGCGSSRVTKTESPSLSSTPMNTHEPEKASADSVQRFLLTAAASDFHAHGPSHIVRFHDVRLGHLVSPSGEKMYMLCGQFLREQEGGKAEWTPFATIKTSGYEQWIGAQAAAFCQGGAVIWDKDADVSSLLQSEFESHK
jgi:hypothetical protein